MASWRAASGGEVADKADPIAVVGVVADEDVTPLPGCADAKSKQAQRVQVGLLHMQPSGCSARDWYRNMLYLP